MDANELIRAGRLTEALVRLTEEVKSAPADTAKRTVLFQVLCFMGQWDKAERHLDLATAGNPAAESGAQVYKNLLAAERERAEVARGARRPSFLGETPPYLELFFTARTRIFEGKTEEAADLLDRLDAELPEAAGAADGAAFVGFRDLDTTLSLFLEAFVYDRYLWIPFHELRELSVTEPKTLLDLLWNPGRVTTRDGITTNCYLPVLYPESAASGDDRIWLGRLTEWRDAGGGVFIGAGQHLYAVGSEEKAILELRDVTFQAAPGREDETPH